MLFRSVQPVETISGSTDRLVLGFPLTAMGRTVATTLTLTPTGDGSGTFDAEIDLEGLFSLSGTATQE